MDRASGTRADKSSTDEVNHPQHYNTGEIEVIDAIEDWGLGFHLGNAVKYIARAGKKNPDKEVEDLRKALWYITRYIDEKEKLQRGDLHRQDQTSSG
jgi:hypothetical protein